MPVNTAKVEGRRKVNYASYHELLTDAERLSSGEVKTLGNWSAGQIFKHLASTFDASIDGFTFAFPWHFRLLARLLRKRILAGPMPAGFQLPAEGVKALAPPPTSTQEGLADLRAAIARLQREPFRARHPVLGDLSEEEWNKVHFMHASLHMSFLVPS